MCADIRTPDQRRRVFVSSTLEELARIDPRSRMLGTIRAFVAEQLAARPDSAQVRRRHAGYYRALTGQADRPLRSVGQNQWLERLESEAGNLAAAVRWYLAHDPSQLPYLFRVLWPFWSLRDHLAEARAWVDQLVPAADSLDPGARAELLWTATSPVPRRIFVVGIVPPFVDCAFHPRVLVLDPAPSG
jgi:hypothetical protein